MNRARPTTIFGLLLRAAEARKRGTGCGLAIVVFMLLVLLRFLGCGPPYPKLATFNIENYPKSAAQEEGAFDAIRSLGASAIAVQEITDPTSFERAAKSRLGPAWRLACSDRPEQRVCVAYDGAVLALVGSRSHPETEVYVGAKPAFEADLLPVGGGDLTRMFNVHLKARGDGGTVRAAQLRALAPVVRSAVSSGDRVVVLGDFNATGPDDVVTIADFACASGLEVASRDVECTAYWNRNDGCLGVALDQVLTTWNAKVEAEGPCRRDGCAMKPACPAFHREVSDHCPVSVD